MLQLGKETVESLKIYGSLTKEMAELEQECFMVRVDCFSSITRGKTRSLRESGLKRDQPVVDK